MSKTMKLHNISYSFYIFLLAGTSLISSCSIVPVVITNDPGLQKLKHGETLFEQKQYEQAEEIFLTILDGHIPIKTANTAIYNLTCTRIMQADTLTDLSHALILLENWRYTSQSIISVENPQMAISAQKKIAEIIESDLRNSVARETQFKQTITRQQKLIETLQHQISALEAIDQELQEKKKPL